jgi:hypothetical protein
VCYSTVNVPWAPYIIMDAKNMRVIIGYVHQNERSSKISNHWIAVIVKSKKADTWKNLAVKL